MIVRARRERTAGSKFENFLRTDLIPQFCADPKRRLDVTGYRGARQQLSEEDARYFFLALRAGLAEHREGGLYSSPKSAAKEQFFWTGPKKAQPRTFTLWIEPLITIGGLARLHFDYGWPAHLIGTQSSDGAFDLVAHLPGHAAEYIAGEVKKTIREADELIQLMTKFGCDPMASAPKSGKSRNAFKKMTALRARRATLFWVLGPDGYAKVFQVYYKANDIVRLMDAPPTSLNFPS